MNKFFCKIFLSGVVLFSFTIPFIVSASVSDGTITPNQYAWGENVGWVNFGVVGGNVHVTSTGLSGYAWDTVYGWINLNPTNAGVKNNGYGRLSGYAWSYGAGYIDFDGVEINSVGRFTGQAKGTRYGRINFDCAHCQVITNWGPSIGTSIFVPPQTIPPTTPPTEPPTPENLPPETPEIFEIPTPAEQKELPSPTEEIIPSEQIETSPEETPTPDKQAEIPSELPSVEEITEAVTETIEKVTEAINETINKIGENINDFVSNIGDLMTSINNFAPNIGTSIQQNYAQATIAINQAIQEATIIAQQAIQKTVAVAEQSIKITKEIVNSPVGSVVTKTVSTVGVATGASISIGTAAFATPVSPAEVWLIPARLFSLLLGSLGIKRKRRSWGTVYDSITKRPLDPVYVSLINIETKKETNSAITDLDGRYGFLAFPGNYRIEVKKTNYTSPSLKLKGQSFDEVYNDLYFGDEISIKQEGEIITKNIPMDPLLFDWNEFAKTKMNVNTFMKKSNIVWAKISNTFFIIGAVVAMIATIFAPVPYNLIIAGFYALAYFLNYVIFKVKKSGALIEKNTNIPLSFAIVEIFREGEEIPLVKKIADKFGFYYALVPKGKYFIKINKKENNGSYREVLKTEIMDIKNGLINKDFVF